MYHLFVHFTNSCDPVTGLARSVLGACTSRGPIVSIVAARMIRFVHEHGRFGFCYCRSNRVSEIVFASIGSCAQTRATCASARIRHWTIARPCSKQPDWSASWPSISAAMSENPTILVPPFYNPLVACRAGGQPRPVHSLQSRAQPRGMRATVRNDPLLRIQSGPQRRTPTCRLSMHPLPRNDQIGLNAHL